MVVMLVLLLPQDQFLLFSVEDFVIHQQRRFFFFFFASSMHPRGKIIKYIAHQSTQKQIKVFWQGMYRYVEPNVKSMIHPMQQLVIPKHNQQKKSTGFVVQTCSGNNGDSRNFLQDVPKKFSRNFFFFGHVVFLSNICL